MQYKSYTLDPFQTEAISAIDQNKSVVVSAPTGSGKTLIADYIINRDVEKHMRVVYTAPIKALSNQKFDQFVSEYGPDKVGLITGDMIVNPEALVVVMTTEIYRNMAITKEPSIEKVSYVIFDEIHYINDRDRGYVWEESIIFSPPSVRFLCLSATIPNAKDFANWIAHIKHHSVTTVVHNERSVPLTHLFYDAEAGLTTLKGLHDHLSIPSYSELHGRRKPKERPPEPNHTLLMATIKEKVPCLFFCFSRAATQKRALDLAKKRIFPHDPAVVRESSRRLSAMPRDARLLPSSRILREVLPYGIAFHHAGLLPAIKKLVEELFAKGLIKVLYTTETFAVGINMPAKAVCFENLRKFDGLTFRLLNSTEYYQIAGRAGRRGIDKEGVVVTMVSRRDFKYEEVKRLIGSDSEPMRSQFRLSVNTALNLLKRHSPQEIDAILSQSFYTYQRFIDHNETSKLIHHQFANLVAELRKKGFIDGQNRLTRKGQFASQVYADEMLFGELFATDFYRNLNEYKLLLLIACMVYERREKDRFYRRLKDRESFSLYQKLASHPVLKHEKRFLYLTRMTTLVKPLMEGKNLFSVLPHTTMLEGDLIRFYLQMVDRFNQLLGACDDQELSRVLHRCKALLEKSLSELLATEESHGG